jgi:glucose/arabinose dehydrogenase
MLFERIQIISRRAERLSSIAFGRQFVSVTVLSFLLFTSNTTAATLPAGFSETMIAGGLSRPTAMDFTPDGRLFVCLQGGSLRVIKNGGLLATPFLTRAVDSSGERGLLGVAFDPNFATNQFVYIYYTVPGSPAHNRVSRVTANGDVELANSEIVLMDLDNLSGATNHNGGAIHFGPDGKLYIAVGDNANAANAQTLGNRLGKVLRLNADGSIPADNPFFNSASGANRSIWALGLRNPFTFAFQPGMTRMLINDVGENAWEEINDGIAGSNYGWNICEGLCSPPNPNFRDPIFQYAHGTSSTTGCAIVGGGFYNPATVQFPASFVGKYFFADLCSGWVRLFDPTTRTASDFASGISQPVDLKVATDGSLYYLSIGSNAVFRIQFNGTPPSITTHPSSQTVTQGQPVTFMVAAGGSTPLSYQWQQNMASINGANSSSYTIASTTSADNGAKFRCIVSNAFGSATSNEATLTVQPPAPLLMTEQDSDSAIALASPVMFRDPFPLSFTFNLSPDTQTRVMVFGLNLDLLPGETVSAITAQAQDPQLNNYQLPVEFLAPLPGVPSVAQLIVGLPSNLSAGQEVLISVTLHGQTSNKVRIRLR